MPLLRSITNRSSSRIPRSLLMGRQRSPMCRTSISRSSLRIPRSLLTGSQCSLTPLLRTIISSDCHNRGVP